ncbi:flap endonuclease [Alteribacter lacisalsi]|jgi:5'-3' exonuclease|uniref:5'-3' exonuclease n=1 Tax=Alteribacter lacisalsi TaxID=2045244 RepID=A0A2W0HAT3_9BACI|nr:5'-3' exonuclease H3TH domain-containing protein [Alteribacter lacisalsi]PYZ98277.1 flap endonuclease [Alteribacter lacisalsi]
MSQKNLLLIDGFNLLSRGHFATSYGRPDDKLKNSEGLYTNALRVFFQKLFNLIEEHSITHMAVAWDVKRDETTRSREYDFYKSQREDLPPPLIEQYETLTVMLNDMGIEQLTVPSYEADDVIGTLASRWSADGLGKCFIYSNDRDLFQLLDENVSQIINRKKEELVYSHALFQEEFGINSSQWVDVKALLGDRSDNIPGCPGIGEKSALPLIREYGSLDAVFSQIDELDQKYNRYKKKLAAGKETTYISKDLSAIICNIAELENFLFESLELKLNKETVLEELNCKEVRIRLSM